MGYNIAIDGPAGAGKSTIAKKVSRILNFIYVDTGAMYRAIAFFFLEKGIYDLEQVEVEQLCTQFDINILYEGDAQQVILNGVNVTAQLRREEVGKFASVVAAHPAVRKKLLMLQRNLASEENVVMDGRDIGSFVLPDAQLKIFLTASPAVRARRRFEELNEKNISCNLEKIEADIIERDKRDMTRPIAPLCQAEDAVLVDSSNMTIDEVTDYIIALYEKEEAK